MSSHKNPLFPPEQVRRRSYEMRHIALLKRTLSHNRLLLSSAAAALLGSACIAFTWTFAHPADGSILADSDMRSIWGDGSKYCAYLSDCCAGHLFSCTCYYCQQESSYSYCCVNSTVCGCSYVCGNSNCVGFPSWQTNDWEYGGHCDECIFLEGPGVQAGKCIAADFPLISPVTRTCP
jgi:hypothetical protein